MGNPIDDTMRDFQGEEVIKHMRKQHKEEMFNMLMKDVEDQDTNISAEGIKNLKFDVTTGEVKALSTPYDHEKNIKRMKKAVKNDDNKTRMDLLPSKALDGIAKIFTFGAKKYNDYNYKNGEGLDWSRPYAALMRHMIAWNDGEDLDQESGKSHLYHAGCCIMMLIDLVDSNIGNDKRYESIDGPPQD